MGKYAVPGDVALPASLKFGSRLDKSADFLQGRYVDPKSVRSDVNAAELKCFDEKYKVPVVVKIFLKPATAQAMQEILVMKNLSGLHGTRKVLRYFEHDGHLCMSFDLPTEDLRSVLLSSRIFPGRAKDGSARPPFSPSTFYELAAQLVDAIRYIHSKGIVHTDISPSTILLASDPARRIRPTITDFGAAVYSTHARSLYRRHIGSAQYRSPEAVLHADWNFPTDIWTLGAVLLEARLGRSPLPSADVPLLLHAMTHLTGRPLPPALVVQALANLTEVTRPLFTLDQAGCPVLRRPPPADAAGALTLEELVPEAELRDLLRRMLDPDPAARLCAEFALLHSYINAGPASVTQGAVAATFEAAEPTDDATAHATEGPMPIPLNMHGTAGGGSGGEDDWALRDASVVDSDSDSDDGPQLPDAWISPDAVERAAPGPPPAEANWCCGPESGAPRFEAPPSAESAAGGLVFRRSGLADLEGGEWGTGLGESLNGDSECGDKTPTPTADRAEPLDSVEGSELARLAEDEPEAGCGRAPADCESEAGARAAGGEGRAKPDPAVVPGPGTDLPPRNGPGGPGSGVGSQAVDTDDRWEDATLNPSRRLASCADPQRSAEPPRGLGVEVYDLLEENRRLLAEARACLHTASGRQADSAAALATVDTPTVPTTEVDAVATVMRTGTPERAAGGRTAVMASPKSVDGGVANGGAASTHAPRVARSDARGAAPAVALRLDLHKVFGAGPAGGPAITTFQLEKSPIDLCAVADRLRAVLAESAGGPEECDPSAPAPDRAGGESPGSPGTVPWAVELGELGYEGGGDDGFCSGGSSVWCNMGGSITGEC